MSIEKDKKGKREKDIESIENLEKSVHLIADDNDVNRFVIKTFLEKDGFVVKDVDNGSKVIELFEKGEEFDFVWLDLIMPIMDGLTCAKILRKTHDYDGPIVGITAYIDEDTLNKCKENGFTAIIPKPISRSTLHKYIITCTSTEDSPVFCDNSEHKNLYRKYFFTEDSKDNDN